MRTARPDLAAVEVQQVTPYLAPRLLPALNRHQKVGNQYIVTVDADVAAQTGRTLGAAPTATTLASASDTFSCAEAIKRVLIPDDEVALMGDLNRAQQKAARIGKRSILRAKEDAAEALITAGAGATVDILGSIRQALDVGIDAVQRVPGRLTLSCGWTTFRRLGRYTEVTDQLANTGVAILNSMQLTKSPDSGVRNVAAGILAEVLGLEEILVGDDDHWQAGTAWLCKLPDPGTEPDEVPQIGRTIQYLPDGEQEFLAESYFDDNLISEAVDTRVWYDQEIYNGSGIYVLTGIDEGNTITTT